MDQVHFSSLRGDWETPSTLVYELAMVFKWDLDVCASRPNVCERFYSPDDDGLSKPWKGLCFMNPPYGRKRRINRWMQKARKEGSKPDTTVVCLPPARTSTIWWQETVPFASLVVFIRGRLYFEINGEPVGPSGFPSAFVVFGDLTGEQVAKLCSYGWWVVPPLYRRLAQEESR